MNTQIFKYNKREILFDYAKSMVGIILTASPVLFLDLLFWLEVVFYICLILFIVFCFRTFLKQNASYFLKENTFYQTGLFAKNLTLDNLETINLRYYSTRKDRSNGWFHLKICDNNTKIVVDSSLDGFDTIIKIVNDVIQKNGLVMDTITQANIMAILDPKRL